MRVSSSTATRDIGVVLTSAVLVIMASLGACTKTTYESYRPARGAKTDIAYVATSADFSKYKRLMADEMGIYYPNHVTISEEDLARVRNAFRTSFLAEVANYDIVDKPAPDVMRVTASLVDLRTTEMDRLPNLSQDINDILQAGKLTFMIEMRDSMSGNVLLRAADTEDSPQLDSTDGMSGHASDVEAAAAHWAELFRQFLDKNLTRP